ncbi:hypothetical protein NDA12_005889 [Ustilago hordei]|nr:hypothetical protein NDA12_005889 [Ustilago hordei]
MAPKPTAAGIPATVPAKDVKGSAAAAAKSGVAAEKKEASAENDALLSGDKDAAQELTNLVKIEGPAALANLGIDAVILKGLGDKKKRCWP